MRFVQEIVPFLVIGLIGGLILARRLGAQRTLRVRKPPVAPPKKKSHLHVVDKATMDRDLNELLKRK